MTGNSVKIGASWYPITRPDLWQACKSENEYFRVLASRQKKGGEYEPLIIQETEEQKQIPGSLF